MQLRSYLLHLPKIKELSPKHLPFTNLAFIRAINLKEMAFYPLPAVLKSNSNLGIKNASRNRSSGILSISVIRSRRDRKRSLHTHSKMSSPTLIMQLIANKSLIKSVITRNLKILFFGTPPKPIPSLLTLLPIKFLAVRMIETQKKSRVSRSIKIVDYI